MPDESNRPWRASRGERYFFVDRRENALDGMDERHIRPCMETGHPFDDRHYASGNYYRTREEASLHVDVPERHKTRHKDPKQAFDREKYLSELHTLKRLRRLGLARPISEKFKVEKPKKAGKTKRRRPEKSASCPDALIPVLVDLLGRAPHRIGRSTYTLTEDGWQREDNPETNTISYDSDGWEVEVTYECTGLYETDFGDRDTPPSVELDRAWGEVTDITASHYDEKTGETTEFSDGELRGLREALDEILKNL